MIIHRLLLFFNAGACVLLCIRNFYCIYDSIMRTILFS